MNGGSQHPDKRRAGGHGPTLADEVEHLLPTPMAADGDRASATYSRGNPTLAGAVQEPRLLPTPTATPYGNNQSASPGAAGRPSLDSLAPMLLPTPTTEPSARCRTAGRRAPKPTTSTTGSTLLDAFWPTAGALTPPPSTGGSESPAGQLPLPLSPDAPDSPA
ncbi:hypothetical protein [Streptomyces lonarensis]|uniref:hypothetical protein n=1 Tax=Streptomyces lonarensis TaxID=700599 RepID=UPI0028AF50F4|nr:hypothetical protein [Streptomyces lonarensis]